MASEQLYRIGLCCSLVGNLSTILLAIGLYVTVKPVEGNLAMMAFSPLRQAKLAAWGPSPGAALAVPGSRPLAAPHPAGRILPSQKKLTK
jgi:hypothetical protein